MLCSIIVITHNWSLGKGSKMKNVRFMDWEFYKKCTLYFAQWPFAPRGKKVIYIPCQNSKAKNEKCLLILNKQNCFWKSHNFGFWDKNKNETCQNDTLQNFRFLASAYLKDLEWLNFKKSNFIGIKTGREMSNFQFFTV